MRKLIDIIMFYLAVGAGTFAAAQIPAPQINLSGNIGCQGFPCVNSGTLIMASDANRTMTAQETSAFSIKVTSGVSLTATRNLVAPAGKFSFNIENATTGGQSIQIIGPSGTGVTIPNGQTVSVWNDGTNYVQVGSSGGGVASFNTRTGAVALAAADLPTALAAQTGCTTAGNAWNPATNTCLATSGGGISALTGDVMASGTGSVAATLATVNTNVGSCGDTSHSAQITLDAKGRATGCTPVLISSGTSATIKYMSLYCSAYQNSDANAGGGTDGTACINALFAAASPTNPVTVWQDKGTTLIGSSGVGIQCPAGGNCTLTGNGAGLAQTTITNCSANGTNAIFTTLPNTLTAGQVGTLSNLQNCHALTNTTVTVLSTGLSSTQFEVAYSGTISSAAENYAHFNQLYGTGFYLASGANIDAIANGRFGMPGTNCDIGPQGGSGASPAIASVGANFHISNVFVNGNANGQTAYCFGVHVVNLNNFTMDRTILYNSRNFSLILNNASDWVVDADTFFSSSDPDGQQTDGVHVDGPSKNGKIVNSTFHTGDDSIALNAWEGQCGPIEGIQISDDYADYSFDFIRMYTTSAATCIGNSLVPAVKKVSINAYNGTSPNQAAILGLGGGGSSVTGTYPYALSDIKWENSTIEILPGGAAATNSPFEVFDSIADLTLSHMTFIGPEYYSLINLHSSTVGNTWGRFVFNDVNIIANANGNAFTNLIDAGNGPGGNTNTVDSEVVNGFSIRGRGVTPATVTCLFCLGGTPFVNPLKYVGGYNIDTQYITGLISPSNFTATNYNINSPLGTVTGATTYSAIIPTRKINTSQSFSTTYTGQENLFTYGGGGITLTLPPMYPGVTKCASNYANSAMAITIQTATGGAGQAISDVNGSTTATGGYIVSSGALGDAVCVTGAGNAGGNDIWQVTSEHGTWTVH